MIEPFTTSDREGFTDTLPRGVAVFTIEEAAKALRIGRSAAYEAVRRGQLPALRLGRKLRIPRTALERLLFEEPSQARVPEQPESDWRVSAMENSP